MNQVSGSDLGNPHVLCIGVPKPAVAEIVRLLSDDTIVITAADATAALRALTTHAGQASSTTSESPVRDEPTSQRTLVRVDHGGHRVLVDDHDLNLSPGQFELFSLLYSDPGQAWSYEDLSVKAWGQPYLGNPDTINTAVRRLRKRLAPATYIRITAVRGYGYRLDTGA